MDHNRAVELALLPYMNDAGFEAAWKAWMENQIKQKQDALLSLPFFDNRVHSELAVIGYMKQIADVATRVRDSVKARK